MYPVMVESSPLDEDNKTTFTIHYKAPQDHSQIWKLDYHPVTAFLGRYIMYIQGVFKKYADRCCHSLRF